MNIQAFTEKYKAFRDADKIYITCDHPNHEPKGEEIQIGKQPAKRNILKREGKEFVCRQCEMQYNNPMTKKDVVRRQTDAVIKVFCPHPEHTGEPEREMKQSGYFGKLEEPYMQVCGSCVQKGKTLSDEQKDAIAQALKGIKRSDEFRQKLSDHMKNNPEGIARATKNILENHCTDGMLGKHHSDETKAKLSANMLGIDKTDEHCENISIGRKKMLEETGGFTEEHKQNLSKAITKKYAEGFDTKGHHATGWHNSPKAGRVFYRSGYEKKAYMMLDEDETVKTYIPENVSTEYQHPEKGGTRLYIIDIDVQYVSGERKLIEVKPSFQLKFETTLAKMEAGHAKANELGCTYEVWTEIKLFGPVYNEKRIRDFTERLKCN